MVLAAVELYDDASFEADEIEDVIGEWMLPTKLAAFELPALQAQPQRALRIGCVVAERARTMLAEIREAIAGDRDLVGYYDALAEGLTERKDIQKKLKLKSVDDVSVIQKRMRRLLERKGLSLVGNSDAGAPEEFRNDVVEEEVQS